MNRIAIVEDELIIAREMEKQLIDLGYEVAGIAISDVEALALADKEKPDLILMDIVIKGERDGIAVGQIIHEKYCIPIVYVTAYADEATFSRAKVADPLGFVIKPFTERELRINIETALYKHQMNKKMKEMEKWFVAALHAEQEPAMAIDTLGKITFLNSPAKKILDSVEIIGSDFTNFLTLTDKEKTILELIFSEKETFYFAEHALHGVSAKEFLVKDVFVPLRDASHKIIGAVIVFRKTDNSV